MMTRARNTLPDGTAVDRGLDDLETLLHTDEGLLLSLEGNKPPTCHTELLIKRPTMVLAKNSGKKAAGNHSLVCTGGRIACMIVPATMKQLEGLP